MRRLLTVITMLFVLCMGISSHGAVLDRVVAVIDTHAITLSELEAKYAESATSFPDITRKEVLDIMINRYLLIRKAQEIRLEAESEEQLIEDYIEFKVRAFIRIEEDVIEEYYRQHYDELRGAPVSTVKKDIERLLIERELNKKLQSHIEQIRKEAYIKIFLD